MLFSDLANHFRGDNRLHDEICRLEQALSLAVGDDIPQEDQTGLVAIDEHPFALIVLARHADTVSIGVRSHEDVSVELLSVAQSERQSLGKLRVRTVNSGEVAILDHLLRNAVYIVEAPISQRTRNHHATGTVERSVDDLQIVLATDHLTVDRDRADLTQIRLVDVFANNLDEILIRLELHVIDGYLVHFVDDAFVVRSQHLGTILPISLVAIVLAWVVAGSDVHACLGFEVTDSEGALRCRAKIIEDISLDAVGREDVCHCLSVQAAVVAAVVANNNRDLLTVFEVLLQIVGKTLCGHANDIDVHAVCTRTHDAAQSAGTKLQVFIETLDELCLVRIVKHSLNIVACLLVKRRREPCLCLSLTLGYESCVVFHDLISLLEIFGSMGKDSKYLR